MSHYITIKDGKARISGCTETPLFFVADNEKQKLLVLYEGGRNYWSGRGQRSYAAAEYRVYVYKKKDVFNHGDTKSYLVENLLGDISFPVRRSKPELSTVRIR